MRIYNRGANEIFMEPSLLNLLPCYLQQRRLSKESTERILLMTISDNGAYHLRSLFIRSVSNGARRQQTFNSGCDSPILQIDDDLRPREASDS